ncbi:hypothetical protein Tco_0006448 [Tanacetum coccineum]
MVGNLSFTTVCWTKVGELKYVSQTDPREPLKTSFRFTQHQSQQESQARKYKQKPTGIQAARIGRRVRCDYVQRKPKKFPSWRQSSCLKALALGKRVMRFLAKRGGSRTHRVAKYTISCNSSDKESMPDEAISRSDGWTVICYDKLRFVETRETDWISRN